MTSLGSHCLLELHGCPAHLLDDHEFIIRVLRDAAEYAGATWLSHTSHKFSPQGVTAVGLLSESHISIHTWPEAGFAAADVFTCGEIAMPHKACEYLKAVLQCGRAEIQHVERVRNLKLLPVKSPTPPLCTSMPLDAAMAPG